MGDRSYVWCRADGRWEARYVVGKDENGKTLYASVYGHSKEEAERKRSDKLRSIMVDSDIAMKMMKSDRPTVNPEITSGVAGLRSQEKFKDPLTETQATQIEQLLLNEGGTSSFAFLLCLYMGISSAEMCAVKYSDFQTDTLHISRVMLDNKQSAGIIVGKPRREIPVPECVLSLIRQNVFAGSDYYILTGSDTTVKKPLYAANMFRKITNKYGIDPIHLDSLRSTFIRRACESSMNTETVSALTDIDVTVLRRRFGGYFKVDTSKINSIYSKFQPLQRNNRQMNLLILGAGSHGHTVKETAQKLGVFQKIAFLDDHVRGVDVLGSCEEYLNYVIEYPCAFVAIGDNNVRKEMMTQLKSAGFLIPRIIDPDATISPSAVIGEGTIVMAQAMVKANARVGSCCILATGSIADYGSNIGDYVHLDSAAMVTRDATLEDMAMVESGDIVRNKKVD